MTDTSSGALFERVYPEKYCHHTLLRSILKGKGAGEPTGTESYQLYALSDGYSGSAPQILAI